MPSLLSLEPCALYTSLLITGKRELIVIACPHISDQFSHQWAIVSLGKAPEELDAPIQVLPEPCALYVYQDIVDSGRLPSPIWVTRSVFSVNQN